MEYFFTSDEHYAHENIIKYTERPFDNVQDMNETLIKNHNEIVGHNDLIIHAGDFAWAKTHQAAEKFSNQLNGIHIFLKGSHDKWIGSHKNQIWENTIDGQLIVVCHYCIRVWARSHYNSWHLFGHSPPSLTPIGKSWNIGVDNNNYYPVSFQQIKKIMTNRPDNPNLIKSKG